MDGEIANDPKPPGRPGRRCVGGHGPATRQVRRDDGGALGLAERQEARQRQADIVELESQGASQAQVLLHRLSQGRHDTSSGHGWARACKAATSTLA